ncbi:unnamed protein product [Blepharisma stoltei]|uniref:Uncharacterized protein n=1 Tax=Blepharisma stoltei TaxID=1481888 RepID=A0AAU9IAK1_9CILI|nr:unnamed protein product [Blepharisma stoltei]
MSVDNFDNFLIESRSSDGKESLLRKCKDTIEVLESELDQERAGRQDLERQNRELLRNIEVFKGEVDDLEAVNNALKFENQEHQDTIGFLQTKIFKLTDELEKTKASLEKEKKASKDLTSDNLKLQELNDELKEEITRQHTIIEEWNEAVIAVDTKLKTISEENRSLKLSIDSYISANEDLQNRNENLNRNLIESHQENESLKHQLSDSKTEREDLIEKLRRAIFSNQEQASFLDKSSQIASQKLQDVKEKLENERKRGKETENERDELYAKAQALEERFETMKIQYEERLLDQKEVQSKLELEVNNLKLLMDSLQSKYIADDTKKEHRIEALDAELNEIRQELENLIQVHKELQAQYQDLNSQYQRAKEFLNNKQEEILSKNQEIYKMEEKSRLSEENYMKDKKNLQDQLESIRKQYSQEMINREKEYYDKIEEISKEYRHEVEKQTATAEFEIEKIKTEVQKSKEHFNQMLNYKEEEIDALNDDRQKLQSMITEMESKIFELSTSLDQTVTESKRMSSELSRLKENGIEASIRFDQETAKLKDEVAILNDRLREESEYYKQIIERRETEIIQIKDRFEDRLKKRVMIFQEKTSTWKEKIRQEIDFLHKYMIDLSSPSQKDKTFGLLERLEKIVSSMIN